MTSRNLIFQRLQTLQTTESLEYELPKSCSSNLLEEFIHNATLAGATIATTPEDQKNIFDLLLKNKEDYTLFISELGVAENGALWYDATATHREKLFLSNTLVIEIFSEDIVATMHDAYEKVNLHNITFGTFISGPSKTADIEQSLVLGAHGAMKLYIFVHRSHSSFHKPNNKWDGNEA